MVNDAEKSRHIALLGKEIPRPINGHRACVDVIGG